MTNQYQEWLKNKKYRLTANLPLNSETSFNYNAIRPEEGTEVNTQIYPTRAYIESNKDLGDNSGRRFNSPLPYYGHNYFIDDFTVPDPIINHSLVHDIDHAQIPQFTRNLYHILRSNLRNLYHRNLLNQHFSTTIRSGEPDELTILEHRPLHNAYIMHSPNEFYFGRNLANILGRHIGFMKGLHNPATDLYEERFDPKLGDIRHLGLPYLNTKNLHNVNASEEQLETLRKYYKHYGDLLQRVYHDWLMGIKRQKLNPFEDSFHRYIRNYKLPLGQYKDNRNLAMLHTMLLSHLKDTYDPRHISKH